MKRAMLFLILVVVIAITVTACGKGKKIDTFLNAMELAVKADEDLTAAGTSLFKDGGEIITKYTPMVKEAEEKLMIMEAGTKEQQDKFYDLKKRIETMASKFTAPEAPGTPEAADAATEPAKTAGKNEKDTIDALLDTYEAMVSTYEKSSSKLSVSDIFEINKKMVEMNNTKKSSKMTTEQSKRLLGLIERLTAVLAKNKK